MREVVAEGLTTTYTADQVAAINTIDEPLQIIACAGSGKTQVISQRIAKILGRPGVEPRNVVAFTFTEKAAAELKERVLGILQEERGEVTGLAEMYIGTMHGYTLDLLQRLVPDTFKYSVLTEITSRLLVDKYSKQSGLTTCPTIGTKQSHLKRWQNSRLYLQVLGTLREDEIDESLVPAGVLDSLDSYVKLIYGQANFDFTAMIALAVELLEIDPDEDDNAEVIQRHIRDDIKYLVVDEYQDVNPLQERLIRGLVQYGANLCVVGDDDQTIYQWRGSEVANIIEFAHRHRDVKQVVLNDNFRSSKGVIELGRSVAELIPTGDRLPKKMVASGHQTWERGDLLALDFATPEDEAAWICDRIEHLQGVPFTDKPGAEPRGLSYSDCAVLLRSVAKDAGPIVEEMKKRQIPYVIKGLNRLFDADEIKACVGIFRYMVNEIDTSLLRELWAKADLLPNPAKWASAVAILDAGKDFKKGERWGVYNIQRLYLDFLAALEIREEAIPGPKGRGELVFYELGKFSQAISDFEQIHFSSEPSEKYKTFAGWLEHQAPDYYAESDSDVGYATPDAVTIATVHQSKGMQWPAVFLPCMRANRFPAQRIGGLSMFHVIPAEAIKDPDRYKGTKDDERRLFYVAVTRAQKFLNVTFSPGVGRNHKRQSEFFIHCTGNQWVSTSTSPIPGERLEPRAIHEIPQVTLSFSELKYLFECPYEFKLRFLYGFNAPLHEALGYGKGLHDALSEVHKKATEGEIMTADDATDLVDRHLHTPFAYPELRRNLERSAAEAVKRYFKLHGSAIGNTVHSEKQIQVHIAPGITVDGRIDLIRKLDTDELAIVDFKSTERAQDEDVTRDQLHVYALGYEELTGENADVVEVLNLDAGGKSHRDQVDDHMLDDVRERIRTAGEKLRKNELPRLSTFAPKCSTCDVVELCRPRPGSAP
ncbi:ATP-dependent helicase [Gordonia sp. WA4-43]|uniref:ATP-dependent helicase n=1 Tax=Gordonia sp. WA4-43 TaxID=2878678 RepID=UPI001CF94338|nr:ATP-dependent DNA helicase [Gordonia sp. WA4-43]UCZ90698.1 ATP-dependent helicase [Gordonia sp. WA4-43]